MKRFFVLLLTILTSCTGSESETKDTDELLTKFFDKKEIQELSRIRSFYDDHILKTINEENTEIRYNYHKFGIKLNDKLQQTGVDYPIDYLQPDSTSIKTYLGDMSLFDEIWKATTRRYRDSIPYDQLTYNSKGKYIQYIKEVSKTDSGIKKIFEPFHATGDISPGMVGHFLFFENFEPFTEMQRLIIAIHYVGMVYPLENGWKDSYLLEE